MPLGRRRGDRPARARQATSSAATTRPLRLRDARTVEVATLEDAIEAAATGWARIPWATVGDEGEATLAQSAITVRCLQRADGSVPLSESDDGVLAVVGRAY